MVPSRSIGLAPPSAFHAARYPFLFESPEQGPNGRFFDVAGSGDDLVDRLHRTRRRVPDGLHHVVFQLGERILADASSDCCT